jgi:hypothetical protein
MERQQREEEQQDEQEEPLLQFIPWCLRHVAQHPHLGVRSAIFGVLGLVSRAPLGRLELTKHKWESSVIGCTSAVTVPADHAMLFGCNAGEEAAFRSYASSLKPTLYLPSQARLRANPAMMNSGAVEVLSVLSGMQSLPASSGNKQRLEALSRQYPAAFQHRQTYLAVQELLGQCRFRLVDRRAINSLFPLKVRLVEPPFSSE